jgi:subtilisin family serine protease
MIEREERAKKRHFEYVPGQMIVRIEEPAVRPHVGPTPLTMTSAAAKLLPAAVSEPIEYLQRNAGLKSVQPLFSTRQKSVARARVSSQARHSLALLSSVVDSSSEELAGITVVTVDQKKLTPSLVRHVNASKAVTYAERMPARWRAQGGPGEADPEQNLQWGLRAINWFRATRPDASNTLVAVMDTGVDVGHPDLANVSITYDHEGLSASDLLGHGTHVAGIIAATANNEAGIVGVANCQLAMWKVFPDQPASDGEFYVDGERYLQALRGVEVSGARALNLSLGGTASSQTETILFDRLQRAGVIVVAAMGNEFDEGNPTEYPAAYQGVLSVGALAETRDRSLFSNTGRHIDLVAPGSNILSTLPRRRSQYRDEASYACWDGTSMATPHVAGAAALVAAKFPAKTSDELRDHLRSTATPLPAMGRSKWTQELGAGLLNLRAALS